MASKRKPAAADPCPTCRGPMTLLQTTLAWCRQCGTLTGWAKADPMHAPMAPVLATLTRAAVQLERRRAEVASLLVRDETGGR